MALARVKTWGQEKLTYQDLNAEFDNLLNNANSLISPATADWDLNGNALILDADGDTSIVNSTDDTIKFNIGGAEEYSFTATIFDVNGNKIDLDADADSSLQVSTDDILDVELQGAVLFRLNGSTASSVNGLDFQASATGTDVVIQAYGTDTNIDVALAAKGSGGVVLTGDVTASNDVTVTNDLGVSGTATLAAAAITADITVGGDLLVDADLVHTGDTDNKIVFTTDTQDFQTGGSSRLDLTNSGLRLGGANARVTTILDEDTMTSNSATSLVTQQSLKAYVDTQVATKTLVTAGTPLSVSPFNDDSTASQAHGLGAVPDLLVAELICNTGDNGWTAGDRIFLNVTQHNPTDGGFCASADATNVVVAMGALAQVINFSTFNAADITEANWSLLVTPFAFS